jgi:hypothetical protein
MSVSDENRKKSSHANLGAFAGIGPNMAKCFPLLYAAGELARRIVRSRRPTATGIAELPKHTLEKH